MIKLPPGRLSGRALSALVTAVRKTPARALLSGVIRKRLGIDGLRALPQELRGPLPFDQAPLLARREHGRASQDLALPQRESVPRTTGDLGRALRSGGTTPVRLAERALSEARTLASRVPTLGPLCGYDDTRAEKAARESLERLSRGEPLGPLDGIPVAIKEEIDVAGFATRLGTRYAGHAVKERDAPSVERLRRAGAVVVGQTPMTELGMSTLGANPHRRMPRNPHDPRRLAGGSSTGSAVAVALGLMPIALGVDGGGSIRVPAAYCGVFGLKPTYGRIPTSGVGAPGTTSVVHLGPIGASTEDLALLVEATAGPDPLDRSSLDRGPLPDGELVAAIHRGVRGLRIGVPDSEWSAASPDIARAAMAGLTALARDGAELLTVPTSLFRWAPAIGYLTLGLEGLVAMAEVREEHMDELGLDLQLVLAGLETFRSDDYVDAQRLRAALRVEARDLLADVDVLALPTAARGPIRVTDDEARYGFIDPEALDLTCRFTFFANVTGLPAATAPVGSDADGMPVGLQIIGDAWDEACVLQVLAHLERLGIAVPPRAPDAVDLLAD